MLASTATVFAQEEKKEEEPAKTTFGGYLDAYYKADISKRTNNTLTSFTDSNNSFELGMASIYAEHKFKKATAFVDLGFGRRSEEFVYNNMSGAANANSQMLIKQAYLSYEVLSGLKFTMGSWATHLGVELVNASDNRNYSMSYAFSNGPFFNTGFKADYSTSGFNFMLGLSQPTDFRSAMEAGSHQKTVIGQVGYAADKFSVYLNGTSGSTNPKTTNVTQGDLVVNYKIADKFGLTFNGTYANVTDDVAKGSKNWFATVLYAKYDHSDKINLTLRSEYFDDKDGASTSFTVLGTKRLLPITGFNVISNTLSLNYKVGNLTIIPEFRIDTSSEKIFADKDVRTSPTNIYGLLGAAYKF